MERVTFKWPIVIGLLLVMPIILFAVVGVIQPTKNNPPSVGDKIFMRGSQQIIIRNIARQPYYIISIESDFSTVYYYLDSPSGEYSVLQLTEEEKRALSDFRSTWCLSRDTVTVPQDNVYLEIGVRCSDSALDYSVQQDVISQEHTSPIIEQLIRKAGLEKATKLIEKLNKNKK